MTALHDRPATPGVGRLAAVAVGALAGLVVWRVGLPDRPVWDTTWKDLTVPAALAVGLGVGALVLGIGSRRSWRVVDMTVAAVLAVAGGLFLWGMNSAWIPVTTPIARVYPQLPAVLNGVWVLRDPYQVLCNFGASPDDAQRALAVCQRYGFNQLGVIGRPNPVMVVLLYDPNRRGIDRTALSAQQARPQPRESLFVPGVGWVEVEMR